MLRNISVRNKNDEKYPDHLNRMTNGTPTIQNPLQDNRLPFRIVPALDLYQWLTKEALSL